MNNLYIFSSNITTKNEVEYVRSKLYSEGKILSIKIDLEDRDKVMKVECSNSMSITAVQSLFKTLGYHCSPLKD